MNIEDMSVEDIEAFLVKRKKNDYIKKEFGGFNPERVSTTQLRCIAQKNSIHSANALKGLLGSNYNNLSNSELNTALVYALDKLENSSKTKKEDNNLGIKSTELDIGSLGSGTCKKKFNSISAKNHVDFLLRIVDGEIKYLFEDLGNESLKNLSWNKYGFSDYGIKGVRYIGWNAKKEKEVRCSVLNDLGINVIEVKLPFSNEFIIPTKRKNTSIAVQTLSTRHQNGYYDGLIYSYMTVPQLMSAIVVALRLLGYSTYLDYIFKHIFSNNNLDKDDLLYQFRTRFVIESKPYRDASSIYSYQSGNKMYYVYAKYSEDYSTDKSFLREFYQFLFNNLCKLAERTKKSLSEELNECIIMHGAWDREHQGDISRCPIRD